MYVSYRRVVYLLAGGGRLEVAAYFLLVYTLFRDFEALRVDSQHLISPPPAYLPFIIDLLGEDLRVLSWEYVGSPRRPPGDPQEAPGKK